MLRITVHICHKILYDMAQSAAEPSVAEPEPQRAESFGRSRSRNAMRLRLRQWY
jgi:hypothetical protein